MWPWYYNEKWDEKKKKNPSSGSKQVEQSRNNTYSAAFYCLTISLPEVCSTRLWSDSAGVYIGTGITFTLLWLSIIPGIATLCHYQWQANSITGANCRLHKSCVFPAVYFVLAGLILNAHKLGECQCTLPLLPGPFCLKLKNWKEEERLFLLGLWLLGFYILQWQSLLISSVTFPVPSQLRRGMGNTLVHTEKKRKRAGRKESMGK